MREEESQVDQERGSRELNELLQELRVTLPGVQVLFAFLLVVPFNQRFTELNAFQQIVYFLVLLCTALSAIFLIAPTTQHRLLWRQEAREKRLRIANTLTILGTIFLALAIGGVLFVIADFLFGLLLAAGVTAVVGILLAWLWYGLPLSQRPRN